MAKKSAYSTAKTAYQKAKERLAMLQDTTTELLGTPEETDKAKADKQLAYGKMKKLEPKKKKTKTPEAEMKSNKPGDIL